MENKLKQSKKILVTGGAGYIGSVLVPMLLESGYKVKVVDDLIYGQKSPVANIKKPGFEFIKANLLEDETVKKAVKNVDLIINLAALVGEPICRENPGLSYRINTGLVGKLNQHRGNIPIISMSSTSVYGETGGGECDETTEPSPSTPYALNKLGAEKIIQESDNYIILRPATAFGYSPRPRLDLLPNDFTFRAIDEGVLEVFNPGVMRTFVHVHDLARVIATLIGFFEQYKNQIYNVGSNDLNFSKKQLAQEILRQYPYDLKIIEDYDDPDKRNFTVNYDKLARAINYQPEYDLAAGIAELVPHYKKLKRQDWHSNNARSLSLKYINIC